MIPKIVHYCWFGGGKIPALSQKCIASWEKYLPEYELRLWNEDNFDIHSLPYTEEAYRAAKYAFVTDYVRLFVLYTYGGIYMDTDVELLKNLDDLLHLPGFSGFESGTELPTGIMACEKHNPWAREQMDYYREKHFLLPGGKMDLTSNVQIISASMRAKGFILNNTYQVYDNCMHIFPKAYFCPKSRTGVLTITPNTYCIHHFAASWDSFGVKWKRWFFQKIVGPKITDILVSAKRKILRKPPVAY